ncbi:MAG: 4-hydroxythreonine-4-phosphate dehydrogenase PdxA [Candidatus Omnitrophica bacterium]|nr:4-hydroxythreonine-4-phosphate dehydrogenase PdxA [Candidatus Omnitrophota bacterium]
MLKSNSKVILITLGDPAGIGPEVTSKALQNVRFPKGVVPVVIGNQQVWESVWPQRKDSPLFIHVADKDKIIHKPGVPTPLSGKDSLLYLEKAVEMIKSGCAHGLVTAPVSKESICRFIPGFKGHTTYLARAFGCLNVEMLFAADKMRLVLVTRHIALREVPAMITSRKVLDVITITNRFLVERLKIAQPRIAVLGLNPHAGEGGHIGREDVNTIVPAINKALARGMNVHGPFPADTFFEPRNCRGYDLVVAMYHDQGLVALKALYFDRLVNITVGLPFIRTSPAHGTAFGIAGKGVADPGSMTASLRMVCGL